MKRLVIDKFYGWISNDPNIWGVWCVNYAEWVEIRENSKKVTLAKWTPSIKYMWPSTTIITWYDVYNSDKFIRIHIDGNITNYIEENIIWTTVTWDKVMNIWEALYNIWNITTPVWKYWFILWATKLYKRVYDNASASLWIYDSTWIVTTPTFSSWTWWTVWAWWTISWWLATHTAWWWANTLAQTTNLATINLQKYRVKIVCWNITADSCQLRLWWVNQYNFSSTDSWKTVVLIYTATWATTALDFNPFSNFAWSFDSIEVYKYNITEQSQAFNSNSPYIIINNFIYVWNGNKVVEIDSTTSTWVFTNVLTIDLDFSIKWISKIWDQVYIYASNWNSTRQYIWNWVDTTVNNVITWSDKNCVNIANWANQDYIITKSNSSNKSWLYLINWYSLSKIFENTQNIDTTKERIYFNADYTNSIETIGNKLLIPWIDWVYTYWQHSPWFAPWLVKEYLNQAWQVTATYYSEITEFQLKTATIWTHNWLTWVWETSNNFFNLSYPNNPNYSGFVVLEPLFWDKFSNIKNFEKISTWFTLDTWCKILYYRKKETDLLYATIALNYNILPIIWAVYTFNSNTFIITSVTDLWDYCILHTTYTWTWSLLNKGTFTKSSWTWDTSFHSNKIRYWYKYIWVSSNISLNTEALLNTEDFKKYYIAFELVNTNIAYNLNTPSLYDINLYYNERNDD